MSKHKIDRLPTWRMPRWRIRGYLFCVLCTFL